MQRWEYLCEHLTEAGKGVFGRIQAGELGEYLNRRGEEGWELVSVIPPHADLATNFHEATVIFRRPRTST